MAKRKRVVDVLWAVGSYTILTLFAVVCVYPFLWTLAASLSEPAEVLAGRVFLWPRGLTVVLYEMLLSYDMFWISLGNTVLYVVVGTLLNVALTMLAAFPLSRTWLVGRSPLNFVIVFTMFFGGGLIPTFLVVKSVGLLNTRWAMIIPGAVSAWNLIMARTYLAANLPDELIEAAEIDGANDLRSLWSVVMPVSRPIIAVITLFYAVGHWNTYFSALIYLQDPFLQPLQVFLRNVSGTGSAAASSMMSSMEDIGTKALYSYTFKHAVVVVGVVPILLIYPLLQRHFIKGMMIGSLKG